MAGRRGPNKPVKKTVLISFTDSIDTNLNTLDHDRHNASIAWLLPYKNRPKLQQTLPLLRRETLSGRLSRPDLGC